MKKIASLLLNWNCEKFIVPHIKMIKPYVDKIIVVQATRAWRNYKAEHNLSDTPDNSEQIIRERYPEIEIYYYEPEDADLTMFHSNSLNFGMSKLEEFDLVLKWDFDQLFTKKDLDTIFNVLHNSNYKQYSLDWARHSVNYHLIGSFEYGLRDETETDPFAIDPKYKFGPLLAYPFTKKIIDEDVTQHHFRNWKSWVTQDWIDGKVKCYQGRWAKDRVKQFTPNNEWIKCPEEIKEYFNHA